MNSDYLKAYHFCKVALDDISETEKELANPTDEWKELYSNYECTVRSFSPTKNTRHISSSLCRVLKGL